MKKLISPLLYSFLSIIFLYGCSATESATEPMPVKAKESVFPEWYIVSEIASDSISFSGYGTAVGSDSLVSIQRAGEKAKLVLESDVSEKLEKVRVDLVDNGQEFFNEKATILAFRKASDQVSITAETPVTSSVKRDNNFRGFAEARISKSQFLFTLKSTLTIPDKQWDILNSSALFSGYFK